MNRIKARHIMLIDNVDEIFFFDFFEYAVSTIGQNESWDFSTNRKKYQPITVLKLNSWCPPNR